MSIFSLSTADQVNLLGTLIAFFVFYGVYAKCEQRQYRWIALAWACLKMYHFYNLLLSGSNWHPWGSALAAWTGTLTGGYLLWRVSWDRVITFRGPNRDGHHSLGSSS
jgi:hypothetical protein